MTKAIYAFSGDPITFGHVNIVKRASKIFDELVVAIGVNPDKNYLFSLEERTKMAEESLSYIDNVSVESFEGLLIDFAYEQGVNVIVKGVRTTTDFAYEKSLDQMGDSQKLGIDTVFLFADANLEHISSSAVKAIQKEQGLIHEYVPLYVKQKLEEKISEQYIVGVTGEIGVGKSYICDKFLEWGEENNVEIHHIELDVIGHDILGKLKEPRYEKIRKTIVDTFGESVCDVVSEKSNSKEDNSIKKYLINRKALGEIVFSDRKKLQQLNDIMYLPILVRLRRELYGKKGLILLNVALIAESSVEYLSNNNIILVNANKEIQKERLVKRGLSKEQVITRVESQYDFSKKKNIISKKISESKQGKLWIIENNDEENKFTSLFDNIKNYFKI